MPVPSQGLGFGVGLCPGLAAQTFFPYPIWLLPLAAATWLLFGMSPHLSPCGVLGLIPLPVPGESM
jgi:hypothetical protein